MYFIIKWSFVVDLVSEEALRQWISLRRRGSAPDGLHYSVTQNWSSRVLLFEEPVVQQFVEWILDEDEDSGEEDGSDEEDD